MPVESLENESLLVDGIEMIGLSDVEEKPPPGSALPSVDHRDSDSDSDNDDDDDSQALLYRRSSGPRRLFSCTWHLWPQIRGIVLEVMQNTLHGAELTFPIERTDTPADDRRTPANGQIPRHSLCASRAVHIITTDTDADAFPLALARNERSNLEMNLSARLCTAANIGQLDDPVVRRSMIRGNLTLLQVQAAVVSFIAAWIAYLLGIILPRSTPAPVLQATINNTLTSTDTLARQSIAIPPDSFIIEKPVRRSML
ncbi:hypothetical protein C0992_009669 [Termitomyces sp. T32_za158]|nr:hypothetical protein C0992_009669 [Termitomyces sp. T32_za158]